MIEITPGLSEYLKRGDGPYNMSPGSTANKKQQSLFKYF